MSSSRRSSFVFMSGSGMHKSGRAPADRHTSAPVARRSKPRPAGMCLAWETKYGDKKGEASKHASEVAAREGPPAREWTAGRRCRTMRGGAWIGRLPGLGSASAGRGPDPHHGRPGAREAAAQRATRTPAAPSWSTPSRRRADYAVARHGSKRLLQRSRRQRPKSPSSFLARRRCHS
jgi:hypothetical protein